MDDVAIRVFIFSILPVIIAPAISVWTGVVGPLNAGWKSSCYISLGSVSREAELVDSSVTLHFGLDYGVHRLADR